MPPLQTVTKGFALPRFNQSPTLRRRFRLTRFTHARRKPVPPRWGGRLLIKAGRQAEAARRRQPATRQPPTPKGRQHPANAILALYATEHISASCTISLHDSAGCTILASSQPMETTRDNPNTHTADAAPNRQAPVRPLHERRRLLSLDRRPSIRRTRPQRRARDHLRFRKLDSD